MEIKDIDTLDYTNLAIIGVQITTYALILLNFMEHWFKNKDSQSLFEV